MIGEKIQKKVIYGAGDVVRVCQKQFIIFTVMSVGTKEKGRG